MQKPPLIAKIDLMSGCGCAISRQAGKLMEAGYVSSNPKDPPQKLSAAISCQQTFQDLREKIKKRFKGNFLREAKKGSKKYVCQEFRPADYAAAMETINKSKPVRCCRQMRPGYLRSASELQEAYRSEPNCVCGLHWSMWWGVFRASGAPDVVGYIQLKRYGDIALYSTILGHGEFLGDGIMPHLHLGVMDWVLNYKQIKWLMYAGWHDGGKGLNLWKRKAGFDPVMFFSK